MLRSGLINQHLLAQLARLGHTDTFVIADAGLPVPNNVPIIDLAYVYGEPSFEAVMKAIMDSTVVEGATVAEEAKGKQAERWIAALVDAPLQYVPHDGQGGLKDLVKEAKFVVRTGENTPYANVILRSGVPF